MRPVRVARVSLRRQEVSVGCVVMVLLPFAGSPSGGAGRVSLGTPLMEPAGRGVRHRLGSKPNGTPWHLGRVTVGTSKRLKRLYAGSVVFGAAPPNRWGAMVGWR